MTRCYGGWPRTMLEDLVVAGPSNGYSGPTGPDADGSPTLRLSATSSGRLVLSSQTTKFLYETISPDSDLWLEPNDVLVQRSNTRDLVGTAAVYDGPQRAYVYPDLMMRLRFRESEMARWVCRYMNSPTGRAFFLAMAAGSSASMPKINGSKLRRMPIPVPPVAEQSRIIEILDRADALRANRRATLALLDTLTQSIFVDLFGESNASSAAWPMGKLVDKLAVPLRNGLSPSKGGRVEARVLTLSAVTGARFDPAAAKTSTFLSVPPADQAVNCSDFLICRGNGNVHLVGKAAFPPASMPEVTFPDTMIAARVDSNKVGHTFLEHVWRSMAVRRQIESLARTTNGTFKINQGVLESIEFIDPPLALQQTFATRIAAVEKLKAAHRASLAELDALFASLQHRAFRGEL
jgi:type I restriction enzyme S subunit